MRFHTLALLILLPPAACGACIAPLPQPMTNNAVAVTSLNDRTVITSFMGLTAGKTWQDISRRAWLWQEGDTAWRQLPRVPVEAGRLAATAVAVGTSVYLFGGYTVAADGREVSTPANFRFDIVGRRYARLAATPVPVDDSVSFVYRNRYIYLVSGWHNTSNVDLVQIYDTREDTWLSGSRYPGTPVFGHAGGIVDNTFVIADGVAVEQTEKGRHFATVNEGWLGTMDAADPRRINYRRLPQLPGRGHYRMAAAGDAEGGRIIFAGGTSTAYNFNGIGYDGEPAEPSAHVFAWDLKSNRWVAYPDKPTATMDHRGLLQWQGEWVSIGGLGAAQTVLDSIHGLQTDPSCAR